MMWFCDYKLRNKKVSFFPILLSMCILCSLLTLPSSASPSSNLEELTDVKGHWAEAVIRKWVSQGLARGYGDGRFGPNDSITRAEFVTLLNRIFGYQRKSDKIFPDVKADAWYAAEIAKAYQAGVISGDNNGCMNPEAMISRQEAAVILTRAFSLTGDHIDAALKYADVNQIAEWALGATGTMTKKGYVTGRPGNLFAPKANLSRSEAVKMIDNVMGELINTAGTHTRVVPGNMVVSSPGVTLKDTYITGDLYLTEGIGSDTVKLIGVAVKGRTIVSGGDERRLSLTNSLLEQEILVVNEEGQAMVTAEGITETNSLTVCQNAVLSEQELTGTGLRKVNISGTQNGKEIVLSGDFDEVRAAAPASIVTLETGSIQHWIVCEEGEGSILIIKDGASVENLTAYASVDITGGKNIKHAEIVSSGVRIDEKPQQVTISEGGTAVSYRPKPEGGDGGQAEATPKPTKSPEPTVRPTETPEPTSKPVPTTAPTPTLDQGTTPAPSPTPGTATPPTQAPTAAPTPTQEPTTAPTPTQGTTYYIDYENGDDANDGTSKLTPWKHAPGMNGAAGNVAAYEASHSNSQGTKPAGDSFIFKGGVTWPNDCFVWCWEWGGGTGWTVGTDAVYFGVDETWYSGESWTRPVFDAEGAPVTTFTKNSPVVKNIIFRVYHGSGGYFIIDNFEFKGMYSFENSTYTMLSVSAPIAEVKNCYFHGWGHGPVYEAGPTDEYYDKIMHSYSYRWAGGNDKDELYAAGLRAISTSTENKEFDIRIHHCYIDGSDAYPTPGAMGNTVAGHVTHFYNNYVAYTQNILTPSFCDYVWGNTFEQLSIIRDVDASNHHNLYQSYGGDTGKSSYVYNNYAKDLAGGATFIWYPSDNTKFYAFNNVVVGDRNQIFQLSSKRLSSESNTAGFYLWNNSVQCVSSEPYSAVNCSPSGYAVSALFVKNNHLIAPGEKINIGVNASVLDAVSNIFHTVAEAESLNYTAESAYPLFSPSESSLTAGTGTDISSIFFELVDSGPSSPSIACQYDTTLGVAVDKINHTVSYPNRTPVKRDSTWDIGAYEYNISEQ